MVSSIVVVDEEGSEHMSIKQSETDWQERCPIAEPWEPIRGPIGPGTIFLYSETTAPLPAASLFGHWQWFVDPSEAAGYLRHVGLPEMLSIWFCCNEWDTDSASAQMGSRQILAGASEHGYHVEDIPFVEGLLGRLETVDSLVQDHILSVLAEVTTTFTARFGQTRTWDLVLRVAATSAHAGAMLAERHQWDDEYGPDELPEPFDLNQWLATCRAADNGDPEAAALVFDVLANNDVL